MLYQTWNRTSVYFKLALSWSYIFAPQVQFYQMKSASADTAASLRDWVTAAFQTMNEVIFCQKFQYFSAVKTSWIYIVLIFQIDLNAIGGSSDTLVDEPRAN